MDSIENNRKFLKNDGWKRWDAMMSDQHRGIVPPPVQKPIPAKSVLINLQSIDALEPPVMPLFEAIALRRSIREYSDGALNLAEVSLLLWATQGIHDFADDMSYTYRSVPSAGARHPFETYLIAKNVEDLIPGLYRYLPVEHQLCLISTLDELMTRAADNSWLIPHEALLFIWTVVPYRTEWRYGELSHKMMAIEAGHICQNLYLASTAIEAGTCAIGAFDQDEIDAILTVDGTDEFAVYMATVGKL